MSKSAGAQARQNLSLGFSLPIIGAAVALVFGLAVYDATRTTLDIWIWVLIQTILGTAMVFGTVTATSAYNYSLGKGKKTGAAKGARNLNFVLGIIWSAVVIIMSFSEASMSVQKLNRWVNDPTDIKMGGHNVVDPLTVSNFLGDFLPALVLLVIAVAGIYFLLVERAREPKADSNADLTAEVAG
ncbi:MAG: hypothetical protein ACKORF_03460 [Micrococcales bacterium]